MNFPENLKYTKEHEWIAVEGNIGTIGITDFAQGEFGDITFVSYENGVEAVSVGDRLGTIEAAKTAEDLYAPVSGKVIAFNEAINDNPPSAPHCVNEEAYGKGWMVKIELSNPAELNELLDAAAYKELIGQ